MTVRHTNPACRARERLCLSSRFLGSFWSAVVEENRYSKERGYHTLRCLVITVIGSYPSLRSHGTRTTICLPSYPTLRRLAVKQHTSSRQAIASSPRGFNGWGNFPGVIPMLQQYLSAFYASSGIIIVAFIGHARYQFILNAVNVGRAKIRAGWAKEPFETDKIDVKYVDR